MTSRASAYLDGSGGPAVFCLGHAHPEVNAAVSAQLESIAYAYRYLFTSSALESLNEIVLRVSGAIASKTCSTAADGSEAVESAPKVALQYFAARGLNKEMSFCGATPFLARQHPGCAVGVGIRRSGAARSREVCSTRFSCRRPMPTGSPGRRTPERWSRSPRPPSWSRRLSLRGRTTVAAFIFEPIVGAAGGVVSGPAGYAAAVTAVCRKYDVLVDRGPGHVRRGPQRYLARPRARRRRPYIMTVAKGLGWRVHPAGGDAGRGSSGRFRIRGEHGADIPATPSPGHTAACAAGLAVQRIIERDRRSSGRARRGSSARRVRLLPVLVRRGWRRAWPGLLHRRRAGARPKNPGRLFRPTRGIELRHRDSGRSRTASSVIRVRAMSTASAANGNIRPPYNATMPSSRTRRQAQARRGRCARLWACDERS